MRVPTIHDGNAAEVKMTPMIDVVFLLLIFFLWTSSFLKPEFDLPSAIAEPPAAGAQMSDEINEPVEPFDEIVVRVLAQDVGFIYQLNGKEVDNLARLKSQVAAIIEIGVQPAVIVDPDENVTMNIAVEVYDAVRAAGADRVLFAVRP